MIGCVTIRFRQCITHLNRWRKDGFLQGMIVRDWLIIFLKHNVLGANSSLLMLAVSSLISGTKPKILMNSLLVTLFSVHCCYVAQLAELSTLLDLRV